jgi:hypothetical protein
MTAAAEAYEASHVKRRRRTSAELHEVDQAIVEAISQDAPVTLRGVYYRVVSMGVVEKTEQGYQLVGRQLIKLRRCGAVPYSAITDGTRLMRKPASWTDLDEMLDDAQASYRRALWHDQDVEVIVLSEKDAISGVIYPVTSKWDVELGIVRGYSSLTFTHSIAETVRDNSIDGKDTVIYQLGDHDPSGLDAWRSFQEQVLDLSHAGYETSGRLPGFFDLLAQLTGAGTVHFERLAVTEAQIIGLNLPTRPTKQSDTRAKGFIGGSVEVDAIPASVLRDLVENAIVQHIDQEKLRLTRIAEQSERDVLTRIKTGGSPDGQP